MKTICLVTPNFNYARYLKKTIRSVLDQECADLEYIIVDGGSTDGSQRIIEQYASQLHYWHSEKDRGLYDAINIGFLHSRAPIMGWLNSDDVHLPWTIQTALTVFAQNPDVRWLTTLKPLSCDASGTRVYANSIDGYSGEAFLDGRYLIPSGARPHEVATSTRLQGCIPQESTFWRRSLWQKADSYIRTDLNLAGDFDLWARFYRHEELYGTNSPLGGFRSQINQKTQFIDRYICEAMNSLSIMQELENWHPNYYREMIIYLKLNKIPKLRNILKQVNGYSGKRVVRQNMNTPNSFWEVEDYKFF
jgi:glycosyltransferase involved in cell wall biosynthesis